MRSTFPEFDLYRELEVDPSASAATIGAAYRALMKAHHPDLADRRSDSRAVRLNLAHEWLSRPARRAEYDAWRSRFDASAPGPSQPARRSKAPVRSGRSQTPTTTVVASAVLGASASLVAALVVALDLADTGAVIIAVLALAVAAVAAARLLYVAYASRR